MSQRDTTISVVHCDAAHVKAKSYEAIDAEISKIGILFTKEILKAIYQSKSLLERLHVLKKKPTNDAEGTSLVSCGCDGSHHWL